MFCFPIQYSTKTQIANQLYVFCRKSVYRRTCGKYFQAIIKRKKWDFLTVDLNFFDIFSAKCIQVAVFDGIIHKVGRGRARNFVLPE